MMVRDGCFARVSASVCVEHGGEAGGHSGKEQRNHWAHIRDELSSDVVPLRLGLFAV